MKSTREFHWQTVTIDRPYEMETLWDILLHLASLTSRGPVVWEARASGGTMSYRIGTYKWSMSRVQEVFQAHSKAHFSPDCERTPVTVAKKLRISRPVLSLNTDTAAATIRAALAAMTGARAGTEVVLQVILGAAHSPVNIPKELPDPTVSWIQAAIGNLPPATPEQHRSAKEKAEQPRYDAMIRLGASGDYTATRLGNIISALRTLESAGVHIRAEDERPDHINSAVLPWRMPLRLSVKETACFLLLPAGIEELPGTPGLHPKLVLPPKWYKEPSPGTSDRTFALSLDYEPRKLSIAKQDALEHTVLLGGTGSGKSTAMLQLILADIKAGRSVLVVDPKADLVTSIAERIPEERKDDVVILDPSDACPVGFNPLALKADPSLTAEAVLSVFQQLFSSSWGVRTADILSGALMTLSRTPGANLLWLMPLLTDPAFRKKVVARIHDPVALEPFWRHFEEMRDSERRTEIAPVLNKLRQIQFRPGLRNVLGQSNPKFNLADLFYERKIVLVPLNSGLVGAESARLLGSLVVGLTWVLALSRASVAPEKRHFVSVFIDELQDYIALPTSFNDALAQARGLGVGFTVAHQYRGQLPPEIKAGIDANCRNKIVFGLQADDAKDMAAEAPDLEPKDFMTLPRYHIYTSFQVAGRSTGWISARTLPPPPPLQMAAELKARSQARYGTPAERVEAELIRLYEYQNNPPDQPGITDAPIGRKKLNRKETP